MTGACWTSTPGCSRLIWMVLNSLGLAALCIPKGACWLNLQEGWWRIFRRQALAGQDFADPDEIALPPGWPPPSSTPAPGPGSGDDPSLNTVPTADALSISNSRWVPEFADGRPAGRMGPGPGPAELAGCRRVILI